MKWRFCPSPLISLEMSLLLLAERQNRYGTVRYVAANLKETPQAAASDNLGQAGVVADGDFRLMTCRRFLSADRAW